MKPLEGRQKRRGDRYDGYLVRNLDPMGTLIPYIMKSKTDSWVLMDDRIDVTHTQEFMREMRRSGEIPNLSLYQVVYAAMVRTIVDVLVADATTFSGFEIIKSKVLAQTASENTSCALRTADTV